MSAALTETAPGQFLVKGELTFHTVMALWQQSRRLFGQTPGTQQIDLAGVTRVDSAAIALLVEWLRLANNHQLELIFTNLPPHLETMAQAYNLDRLLPVHG